MSVGFTEGGVIGRSVARVEDRPLVTGRGRFAGDIDMARQLHMRVARADRAHARLLAVDVDAARTAPGVVAVWTAEDLPPDCVIEFRDGPNAALAPFRQPVLARDRLRYVGEPVAVVFADSAAAAEDAAELIAIDAEDLPPVLSASDPPSEFAPGLTTEASEIRQGYGDLDAAFAEAALVIENDVFIGRHSGVPLETRGAIGVYDAARDMLELHGAAKVPHRNRESLAWMLGRPPSSIHLYESHVGGGFGVRGELYPEDVLVLLAAMRLGRPIKWIEDRREHLMAANHSREQRHVTRAAVAADGAILAIDNRFFHDQGAYVRTHGDRVAVSTCGLFGGPYRMPAYRARGAFRLTNKTPAATYRAPSRFETNFARERLFDAIARRLGLDRVEVRRRNLIGPEEMPYERSVIALGEDVVHDSGDYPLLLDKALARFGWREAEADAAARRARGACVGLGVALFVEKSGLGPVDGARVVVDSMGGVEAVTGGASIGQGFETLIAQIVADTLGVDYATIRVTHGRTDRIDYGLGAHASRASVMSGNAAAAAAAKVRDKALDVAAKLLQRPAETLAIADGVIAPREGDAGPSVTLAEIARALAPASKLRGDREPGLAADGWFETAHQVYPYGVHLGQVAVDPETGGVTLERALVAYDVGRAVNPAMVRGQIVGGFAQGLGGALYEEFRYDADGQPLSVSFADYLTPTAAETVELDVLITEDAPSPRNPLGIKGAGEAGVAAVGAMIASALDDALGLPGAIDRLPATPQRIRALLRARAAKPEAPAP